jgi:N-glycosylase/DNA lyase
MQRRRAPATPRELRSLYDRARPEIELRLSEFQRLWSHATEEELFAELSFCLLTPQSKAKACWSAVCGLRDSGLLARPEPRRISSGISGVRFHNNKGRYIAEARGLLSWKGRLGIRGAIESLGSPAEARDWLASNVKGMGLKEASHFLRNIGLGNSLAILDRHVLRNMAALGYIPSVPKALTRKRYLELERAFMKMARDLRIPPAHLDMLLWYREAGEIFK